MRNRARRFGAELRACFKAIWPACLLASLLILWGFAWSLPDNPHIEKSFHADENAAVWGVDQIHFPKFNPHLFNWGTALLYQVYVLKILFSLGGLLPVSFAALILMGRLVVWLSALGTLMCLYLLCREIFDDWTARLAVLILAVMPGFIINSHYFKTDIPMGFWLVAALLAGYRLMARGGVAYVYALGLLTGYSISTKYSAAPVIAAGLVCIAMSPLEGGAIRKIRAIIIYGVCVGLGFLIGTPRVLPNPHEFLATLRWVAATGKTVWPSAVARGAGWSDYLFRIARLTMTGPIWVAAGIGMVWLTVRLGRKMLPLWAFLGAYTLLLNADNTRLMRYLVPVLPVAALAAAGLIGGLRRAGAVGRTAAMAGSGILIIYPLLFTVSYVRVMTEEDPRIQASEWVSEHVPRDLPFPVSTSHYLGAPQVQLWGYQKLEVTTDLRGLQGAASPYVAVSEYITQKYDGAVNHYPEVEQFFDYIHANYTEVARFENSQRLWGIDSKCGATATHDWLYPNPRITIFRRRDAAAAVL